MANVNGDDGSSRAASPRIYPYLLGLDDILSPQQSLTDELYNINQLGTPQNNLGCPSPPPDDAERVAIYRRAIANPLTQGDPTAGLLPSGYITPPNPSPPPSTPSSSPVSPRRVPSPTRARAPSDPTTHAGGDQDEDGVEDDEEPPPAHRPSSDYSITQESSVSTVITRAVTPDDAVFCPYCDRLFKHRRELLRHQEETDCWTSSASSTRSDAGGQGRIKCSHCNRVCRDEREYGQHRLTSGCGKAVPGAQLRHHQADARDHHRETDKHQRSPATPVHSRYEGEDLRNTAAAGPYQPNYRTYSAPEYNLRSRTPASSTHTSSSGDYPYSAHNSSVNNDAYCRICDRTFKNEHGLAVHRGMVHKTSPLSTTPATFSSSVNNDAYCNICDRTFINEHGLAVHWGKMHKASLSPTTSATPSSSVNSGVSLQMRGTTFKNMQGLSLSTGRANKTSSSSKTPASPSSSMNNDTYCTICERTFKNIRGLAVHKGKMHK